jgi:hypothetical protein
MGSTIVLFGRYAYLSVWGALASDAIDHSVRLGEYAIYTSVGAELAWDAVSL